MGMVVLVPGLFVTNSLGFVIGKPLPGFAGEGPIDLLAKSRHLRRIHSSRATPGKEKNRYRHRRHT